jgi:hypothetical protein|tara:strand:+ start:86 stop:271 length:186 start_codon:yes stop_codon:yes gene_type:complete
MPIRAKKTMAEEDMYDAIAYTNHRIHDIQNLLIHALTCGIPCRTGCMTDGLLERIKKNREK